MSPRTAVVWELTCARGGMERFRIMIAGDCLLTQSICGDDQRPRWDVNPAVPDPLRRALDVTSFVEEEYGGVLTVPPTEILLHDSELRALKGGAKRIPPALRARAYTSLHRGRAAA